MFEVLNTVVPKGFLMALGGSLGGRAPAPPSFGSSVCGAGHVAPQCMFLYSFVSLCLKHPCHVEDIIHFYVQG